MTTFIKKKLKDREGNYLVTPSSADIVYCSDGETVATKLRKVENDEFSPTITQMSSVSKVGVGEDIDISDNTQEGYLKSAILSGQTLVNLLETEKEKYTFNNQQNWVVEDGYLKCNGTSSWHTVTDKFNDMIKPSTKYLLRIEIVENTLDMILNFDGHTTNITQQTIFLTFQANEVGVKSHIVTTAPELDSTKNGLFRLPINITNGGTLKIRFMAIEYQEGMENWDIPYFEGMQSVKMPVLTTCGKNLFDMNRPYDAITDSQATVIQDTNQITVSSAESGAYVSANFILNKDFFAGKTVTGSCLYESDIKDIGTVQITYQDGNGEHHYQWIKTPRTFTFPNSFIGDVMLSISANNTDTPQSNTVTVKNIQLELGSTATSYEPFKSNILTVNEPIELRGIGDVKDELNLLTGEVVERTGEIVLNGNESWKLRATTTDVLVFNVDDVGINSFTDFTNSHKKMLCDKFVCGYYENNNVEFTCCRANGKGLLIGILKSRLSTPDIEGLKAWLSSNNVTVQYQLANEQIKTVDLKPLGTNPTTQPYVWKDGHIQLSSEEGSLLPTLDYSVTTSRGGQILENTKHIAKQDKRIYDLEMLMINSSVEDAYQRLLLQNDVQVMSRMDETHLNPMRYYMLTRLIEEKMYEETDMLNKLDTFFLYGDISSDQYFELMDKIFGMEEIIEEDFTEEK